MGYTKSSFVEHVAIYVKDIAWYIDFFDQALGMKVKQVDGSTNSPKQIWTIGGLQFISDPSFDGRQGQMAHFGIVTENLVQALQVIYSWENVAQVPDKDENWVLLPDGLILELFEQKGNAVREVLSIDTRE